WRCCACTAGTASRETVSNRPARMGKRMDMMIAIRAGGREASARGTSFNRLSRLPKSPGLRTSFFLPAPTPWLSWDGFPMRPFGRTDGKSVPREENTSREPALRFRRLIAHARNLSAAGTTGPILGLHHGLQIDPHRVRQRGQPGEHVREFLRPFLGGAAAQRRRQLADFFHEPHERAFHPAAPVLGVEGRADHLLELRQRESHGPPHPLGPAERFRGRFLHYCFSSVFCNRLASILAWSRASTWSSSARAFSLPPVSR